MRVHAFVAVQLRIGAALSNAAEARFRAWARPRVDAVHTVTHVPDSDEARLRRYATAAFADDLVTTNAANLACRAARLLCNGEKSSGARIVKTTYSPVPVSWIPSQWYWHAWSPRPTSAPTGAAD